MRYHKSEPNETSGLLLKVFEIMLVNNGGDYPAKSNLIFFVPETFLIVCSLIDIHNIFTGIREQQWISDNYYLYNYEVVQLKC